MEAHHKKTIEVPGPILSRAFQELSQGMVCVTDLRKIRDVPFPFPYSQYLLYMLIAHWILAPLVASQVVLRPWWAGIMVLVVSTSYWTLFYIAQEIDQPFGEDANDLPVREMQQQFNTKLQFFLEPASTKIPDFTLESSQHLHVLRSSYKINPSAITSPYSMTSVTAQSFHMDDGHRTATPERQDSSREVQGFSSLLDPLEPRMIHELLSMLLPDVDAAHVKHMLQILGIDDQTELGTLEEKPYQSEDFERLHEQLHEERRASLNDVSVRVDDFLRQESPESQEPELQRSFASLSEALAKTMPRVKRI